MGVSVGVQVPITDEARGGASFEKRDIINSNVPVISAGCGVRRCVQQEVEVYGKMDNECALQA